MRKLGLSDEAVRRLMKSGNKQLVADSEDAEWHQYVVGPVLEEFKGDFSGIMAKVRDKAMEHLEANYIWDEDYVRNRGLPWIHHEIKKYLEDYIGNYLAYSDEG